MAVERAAVLAYPSSVHSPIDLKQMALSEKLRLMEALWDDLCSREEEVSMPEWHKTVLDERERQIAEGTAIFTDWDTAKGRIRKRTHED